MPEEKRGIVRDLRMEFGLDDAQVHVANLKNSARIAPGDRLLVKGEPAPGGGGINADEIKVISEWRRFLIFALVFFVIFVLSSLAGDRDWRAILWYIALGLFGTFCVLAWRARAGKWPPNNILRWL